jgi:hypothetical protein
MEELNYYIGVKQVQATPQDKDGQPGYKVVYPDGYVSWSPKAVFEASYFKQGADPTRITQAMVADFLLPQPSGSNFLEGQMAAGLQVGTHAVVLNETMVGFDILTESACVDIDNYDHELGYKLAREKAESKVWELLGFVLCWAKNGLAFQSRSVHAEPIRQVVIKELQ